MLWAKLRVAEELSQRSACAHQCPLINSSKAATTEEMQPVALAMLDIDAAQPRIYEFRKSYALPISHHPFVSSATLLDLACALTV